VLIAALLDRPGWRWVFFVNLPVCALVLAGVDRNRCRCPPKDFDGVGALLSTAVELALVYALVNASEVGMG
jgi:hypothetical protein